MPFFLESPEVKGELTAIIDEYLRSSDGNEVARRIRALRVSPTPSATSDSLLRARGALSTALAIRAAALGVARGDEATERISSLLVQLALSGVISPSGIADGLRVAAARLPDARLDAGPVADARLAALAGVLVQCGVMAASDLDPASIGPKAVAEAVSNAGVAGADPIAGGASGLAIVARQLSALLSSHTRTPLLQLRSQYEHIVGRYLATGGGGLEAFLSALASAFGAPWARHELARTVVVAYIEAGAGGIDGGLTHAHVSTPAWLIRTLTLDLICELVTAEALDVWAVSAAFESALIGLPTFPRGSPAVLGAAIAFCLSKGLLPAGWVVGKHSSLGGFAYASASASASAPAPAPASASASAPAPFSATVSVSSPLKKPNVESTPALGPLLGTRTLLDTDAAGGLFVGDVEMPFALGDPALPSPPCSPPFAGDARDKELTAMTMAALTASLLTTNPVVDTSHMSVREARLAARAAGAALARGDDVSAALTALSTNWGGGARGGGALGAEVIVAAFRVLAAGGWDVNAAKAVGVRAARVVKTGDLAVSALIDGLAQTVDVLDTDEKPSASAVSALSYFLASASEVLPADLTFGDSEVGQAALKAATAHCT